MGKAKSEKKETVKTDKPKSDIKKDANIIDENKKESIIEEKISVVEEIIKKNVLHTPTAVKCGDSIGNRGLLYGINSLDQFDPTVYGLSPKFCLTDFTDLKELLEGLQIDNESEAKIEDDQSNTISEDKDKLMGIGLDCCVTKIRDSDLLLVQTTDFFYPLVDDPYLMGKITCANVLSDLYALGVTICDNMLMLLGICSAFSETERKTVVKLIIKGFRDQAKLAGTRINGGQTIVNPWMTIGGTATTVCKPTEIINPNQAVVGDVLVLTKPLGVQVAVNAYRWLYNPERSARLKLVVTEDDVRLAYYRACDMMARLNRPAARLMHKYNAHGATDVTGFGILGHANNLANIQANPVSFVIHNLPIINKMSVVSKACGNAFGLLTGTSSETSGGLLIIMQREQATLFCKEFEKIEGCPAWIVGVVEKGDRTARIIEKPRIITVPAKEVSGKLW
ncbi:hypothetical protein A3Q56_00455 [Intoshia linei]|uniref:Selenide, water dikinase n=1 Tax=Intoshia linei TaxID=1819745 RepID=A0A177BE04_9BILA|nr:hypothetical protein A3Q56_00455 [Intoshia linei]